MRSHPPRHSALISLALGLLLLFVPCGCKRGGGKPQNEQKTVVIPPSLTAAASGLWSAPATWGGAKPADYQEVTVPSGLTVTLDENSPALGALMVEGTLVIADKDIELKAGKIFVMGSMSVGTESAPFMHRAIITLGGNPGDPAHGNDFMVMGGTLDLHGEPRGQGWTRLAQTATAGASQLVLQQPMTWRPGDRIVIASTDFDMNQAEDMIVSAVSGNVITLDAPLLYTHWGADESGVEERAEVGLLSRNVKVQGHEGSVADGQGGHVMAMRGSTIRISGAEFTRMGLRGVLARYPVHFHMMGDALGSYIKDSSIHHSFNRCVTIHGSHNTVVSGNVAYDTLGHCYFFEDGVETGNLLENNLGLVTRTPDAPDRLTESDDRPSTFWIANPDNIVRGNAAAGSDAFGIWYYTIRNPTGLSATDSINLISEPIRECTGNVTHSNGLDGFFIDSNDATIHYHPTAEAFFSGLVSYKNRRRGFWLRCSNYTADGFKLADNLIGGTLVTDGWAQGKSYLINSIIVGETANLGNPAAAETKGLDGRSLPEPTKPNKPVQGLDFYDGLCGVENTQFINFRSNSQRQAGALSGLRFNEFGINTGNFVNAVTFPDGANRVYFDPLGANPERPDDEDGHKSLVFLDKDGSVTGTAGRYVVVDNPFLVDATASFIPEWNAWVSPAKYGQLRIFNEDQFRQPMAPVAITRADGQQQVLAGLKGNMPRDVFDTSLMDGRTYSITPTGQTPRKLWLQYRYRTPGDWIQVSMPYPHSQFTVVRNNNTASPLAKAASLAELSASQGAVYYHDGTRLHFKLMIQTGRTDTTVDVGP